MTKSLVLLAATLGLLATGANAAPLDCAQFMTGHWTGKGEVNMFGKVTKLDDDYTFNDDGSFITINRYTDTGGAWQEQKGEGKWTATASEAATACTVGMNSTFEQGSSSSTFTVTRIDDATWRSMDFDMTRVAD